MCLARAHKGGEGHPGAHCLAFLPGLNASCHLLQPQGQPVRGQRANTGSLTREAARCVPTRPLGPGGGEQGGRWYRRNRPHCPPRCSGRPASCLRARGADVRQERSLVRAWPGLGAGSFFFVVEQKPDSQRWRQKSGWHGAVTDSSGAGAAGPAPPPIAAAPACSRACLQAAARQRRGKPGPGALGAGERPRRSGGAALGPAACLPRHAGDASG